MNLLKKIIKRLLHFINTLPLIHAIKELLGKVEFEIEKLKLAYSYHPFVDEWIKSAKDLHKGKRCFIIATGPSLNKLDLSKLKGEICFGVNGTYMLNNVDLSYFVYVSDWWHKQHIEGLRTVKCIRRFLACEVQNELASVVPTTWYNKIDPKYHSRWKTPLPVPAGFSYKPDRYIYAGGSVVFVCLQLAFYMGFSEVIIIGLDHSYSRKKDNDFKKHGGGFLKTSSGTDTHFSSVYNKPGAIDSHIDLDAMERGYNLADKAFEKNGRHIFNASAKTQLTVFQRVDFDSLFN